MGEHTSYDVIIIGAGPGGMTAGIYSARAGMRCLIIERAMPGGQLATTDVVENYPGFAEPIAGTDLAERMREQAGRAGVEFRTAEVTGLTRTSERVWTVRVGAEDLAAHAVIIASGASPKRLGIPGEETFWGRGISCCATCDGRFFQDRVLVIIGGGDTAAKETLFLTRFASEITIVHRRDRLRATKLLRDRLLAMPAKVRFRWNSVATKIDGGDHVESVTVKDLKTGREQDLACDGVFLFVGFTPNTGFAATVVKTDERGCVLTDDEMATSAPGIFACGDARKKLLRQIVTACGEGATAAFAAQHYVEKLKGTAYE